MQKHSVIAWLDFRRDDLDRARDFIRSLQEDGVLDELGFLALQGRFSDVFYPATSTLMRSSRYLYFIAGIYRQLEREGVTSREIRATSRHRQDLLRDALSKTETVGVIGRDAQAKLKQFPSSVYWSGMRSLGIFRSNSSEAAYQATFDDIRKRRRGYADDDKTVQASDHAGYWDDSLPPSGFLDSGGAIRGGVSFKLTKSEAQDLAGRYRDRFPSSLLVHMLNQRVRDTEFPWRCPRPDPVLDAHLRHAQCLSMFARGATLQYYQLLMEARDRANLAANVKAVAPAFERWWEEARRVLQSWTAEALSSLSTVQGAMRPGPRGDLAFVDGWLERFRSATSADRLLGDAQARELVRAREIAIKPMKSRLKHPKHLKQFEPKVTDQLIQFDYRHRVGSTFVREILDGLGHGQ